MRKAEILRLAWEDVDLEHGVIHVHFAKSGRSRDMPLCSKLRNALEAMPRVPGAPVFNMPEITFRRLFYVAHRASKLPHFRFHDLRHTFASHFVMKTGDLPALQKILGHSTPGMVLRYAHLAKGHLVSEMAAFESALPSLLRLDEIRSGHRRSHQAPSLLSDGRISNEQKSLVNSR